MKATHTLVPLEPTSEMLDAAINARGPFKLTPEHTIIMRNSLVIAYRAMIAAAPAIDAGPTPSDSAPPRSTTD